MPQQTLEYSAATDVGLKRINNEDRYLSLPERGLWLVADGMGGHAAGEVASAIVCDTLMKQKTPAISGKPFSVHTGRYCMPRPKAWDLPVWALP
jgi:protein phosphatase